MALADYAAYKAAIANPRLALRYQGHLAGTAGNTGTFNVVAPDGSPGTARALGRSNGLCPGQLVDVAGQLYAAHVAALVRITVGGSAAEQAKILVDRLVETAGLSGSVTTEQTTNLPTPALTRYTDGQGVFAALQLWSALGSTGVTATINYTNSAGTTARSSKPVSVPANSGAAVFLPFALQDGDVGVRSVEGVTLSASTGAAGNFGVVLFRPLLMLPAVKNLNVAMPTLFQGGAVVPVHEDACIDEFNLSHHGNALFNLSLVEA